MSEVTRLLGALGQGDPHAAAQLLPLVYDEPRRLAARKLAREKPGQTLGRLRGPDGLDEEMMTPFALVIVRGLAATRARSLSFPDPRRETSVPRP
jgi:hypothetical protein